MLCSSINPLSINFKSHPLTRCTSRICICLGVMEVVVFCIAIMKRFQGHFMFFLPFGFELAEATLNQGLHLSLPPPKIKQPLAHESQGESSYCPQLLP